MPESSRTIKIKVERKIPASPSEVFGAWMNPKIPANIWSVGEELILKAGKKGLFYLRAPGAKHYHYGRFTEFKRPGRIQHTWLTWYTLGLESMVTITFKKKGNGTLMTILHSGLPDTAEGRSHKEGWNKFLDLLAEYFEGKSRRA
jgi:uncharacterized protein YndB with AHSA1/START domain